MTLTAARHGGDKPCSSDGVEGILGIHSWVRHVSVRFDIGLCRPIAGGGHAPNLFPSLFWFLKFKRTGCAVGGTSSSLAEGRTSSIGNDGLGLSIMRKACDNRFLSPEW